MNVNNTLLVLSSSLFPYNNYKKNPTNTQFYFSKISPTYFLNSNKRYLRFLNNLTNYYITQPKHFGFLSYERKSFLDAHRMR